MSSDKKDLEIVYNLQWKRKINNGDDKANIVGMLDTPSTTLNWEVFKSYLLKNAGAINHIGDINVSYIDSDDDEIPIDSQTEFQAALYSFRKRAHAGDIITLKLDKVSNFEMKPMDSQHTYVLSENCSSSHHKYDKNRYPQENDVAYGFDVMTHSDSDVPLWFQKYMNKFKSQVVEEITSTLVPQLKIPTPNSCSHSRKPKSEPPTKLRHKKLALHTGEPLKEQTKEYVKALKIERKLDNKLEKLEYKTKKIKEKKSQLGKYTDHTAVRRPIGQPLTTNEVLMDAAPLDKTSGSPPHFVGGETYVQEWKVINNGQLPWNEETELRHAWGSQALTPLKRSVRCPPLLPGESGVVKVILQIPTGPGNYECYWHFHQANRRFGHWLGCQIVVDAPVSHYSHKNIKCQLLFKEKAQTCNDATQSQQEVAQEKENEENIQKVDDAKVEATNDAGDENGADLNNFDEKMLNSLCINDDSSIDSSENSEYEVICIPNYKDMEKQDVGADFVQIQEPHLSEISSSDQGSDDNNNNNPEMQPRGVTVEDVEDEDAPVQHKHAPVQHEHAPVQHEHAPLQHEHAPVQHEHAAIQHEHAATQREHAATQHEHAAIEEDPNDSIPHYGIHECSVAMVSVPMHRIRRHEERHLFSDNYVPNIEEAGPSTSARIETDGTIPHQQVAPKDEMCDSAFFDPLLQQSSWRLMDDSLTSMSRFLPQPMPTLAQAFPQLPHQYMPTFPLSQQKFWAQEYPLQPTAVNNFNGHNYSPMYHTAPPGMSTSQQLYRETEEGRNNERRLFVFPHKCPGYEVVYPNGDPMSQSYNVRSTGAEWNIQNPPTWDELASSASSNLDSASRVSNSQYANVYASGVEQPCCKSPASEAGSKQAAEAPPVAAQPIMANPAGPSVQLLPETFVTGAVNVASSAINTARSVLHMLRPNHCQGRDWNGPAWPPAANQDPVVEDALRRLQEMGFWNRELNITLLNRYKNDIEKVITDLIQ